MHVYNKYLWKLIDCICIFIIKQIIKLERHVYDKNL
jgi:hypothetical protein